MSKISHHAPGCHLTADALLVGGGAGTWAALSARTQGAERVVLVDKG